MKTSMKKLMLVVGFTLFTPITSILASEIVHEFNNPAFSGNGYSQHVLSVNQLEIQRKQKVADDKVCQAEREKKYYD